MLFRSLSHSTTYTFRVSAVNAVGTGTASDTANAATRGLTITQVDGQVYSGNTSVAIDSSGFPIVVGYVSPHGPNVWSCENASCTSSHFWRVNSFDDGLYNSIVIGADGNPVIAMYDQDDGNLRVVACSVADCENQTTIGGTILDSTGDVGSYNTIALGADDNPVIAYSDSAGGTKIAACSNPTCTAATVSGPWEEAQEALYLSIAIGANGNPVISLATEGPFHVFDGIANLYCSNPTCTELESGHGQTRDTGSNPAQYTSLAIGADGNPITAYGRRDGEFGLNVQACKSSLCGHPSGYTPTDSTNTLITNDLLDQEGQQVLQLAIGTDDMPVIAFVNSSGNIALAECSVTDCSSDTTITTIEAAQPGAGVYTGVSIAIRQSDNARVITYHHSLLLKIAVVEAP